ncbi:C2 and C2B_Munc13-like domain-containing protein staccato isoform X3 [Bombus fervidus]|uniref:C2 and C2B_Munc13-like domain-containing protein staccato isoform X3 n=1 Tax=Bombus fervidus TaxID=203811 RepID=UPI003AB5734E
MLAIFEKLKHRRKKSSKRLSFKSTEVRNIVSEFEKKKDKKKMYKNKFKPTGIKTKGFGYRKPKDTVRNEKYLPSKSSEIENGVPKYEKTKDSRPYEKYLSPKSSEIKNSTLKYEITKGTEVHNKEYLTNKNLSIMTDDESDSCVENSFVGMNLMEKKPSKANDISSRSLDEYIIVSIEEKPATVITKNVHDNSDSESVKTSIVSRKNCCTACNDRWYMRFKQLILRTNRISPCMVTGIQETDGGFFENLGTLLAEKVRTQEQEEGPLPKKKDEVQETGEEEDNFSEEGSIEEPVDALLETDSDRDENEHATNFLAESMGWNIEELYAALVFMTQHQVGYDVSKECELETLLNYLQNAFKVDNDMHERVLHETKNMEPPEMHLNVEVIEAKELVSKDSNGKSDPFCALYLESAPTRRYNTAVKTSTLSPVWEEHFELPLEDPENDVLYLEVWDFDAAETVPEKMSKVKDVKGVRGLVKLAKEIAVTATTGCHDNEFIGRCRIPLKDIPTTGHTMWYSLEKKNKSKRRGVVKLRLAFSAEHNAQVAAQEYRHLIRVLLLYEIETQKIEKYCWCGRWSAPAEVLLLQHSAQRGLLARNVTLAQWIEYSRIHQEHPLNFTVFNKLAIDLLRPMENGLFSVDETRLFWDATKKLLYSCLNSIRKIRRLTIGDKNAMTQLSAILGILSSISSLKVPEDINLFPAKMYPWFPDPDETLSVLQALEYTVEQGGIEWFDHILNNNFPENESDEDALKYHIKVIQLVRADLQNAIDNYDKLFIKRINFPYARCLYMMYEKRISDICMIVIEDVCGRLKRIEIENADVELNLGTTLFELYLALQRYVILGQVLCAEGQLEEMKVQTYYNWFRAGVAHWLDIAVYKALKRIDRAVEFDTLQAVDNSVQYSSSAVDTLTIFYQIKVFWTQLAWPDTEGSYTFIAKIIDDICKCSIAYADKMAKKAELTTELEQLSESSVYERRFSVSTAWCFAINNIDYIRTSIAPLANDLGLQNIVDELAEKKTQEDADRCKQTLQLIIDNATDTVKNKIIELLQVVADKMSPAMNRYLMEGAELIDTTSNTMDRLLQYLDSNLSTLHDYLNEDNFERILHVIWDTLSESLYQLVHNNLERRRPPSFYSNLHRTLHTLIRYFNVGADETANVKVLEKIEHLLELHGLETAELIHRYHQERIKEQNELEESEYGQITVKAQFVDNSLNIQILNARKLRPVDSNGDLVGKVSTLKHKLHTKSKQRLKEGKTSSCDSYVKVKLLPEEKFADVKLPKTHVQKENLYPLYDEIFNIPLTSEQRATENAIVVFELKDKDFLRSRFMAEAFLPFSEIPETGPDRGIESLDQIHLNLSRPTRKSTDVIQALEHRKGDNQATEFLSKLSSKAERK